MDEYTHKICLQKISSLASCGCLGCSDPSCLPFGEGVALPAFQTWNLSTGLVKTRSDSMVWMLKPMEPDSSPWVGAFSHLFSFLLVFTGPAVVNKKYLFDGTCGSPCEVEVAG